MDGWIDTMKHNVNRLAGIQPPTATAQVHSKEPQLSTPNPQPILCSLPFFQRWNAPFEAMVLCQCFWALMCRCSVLKWIPDGLFENLATSLVGDGDFPISGNTLW